MRLQSKDSILLQATPFVPGRVQGVLRRGLQGAAPDSIVIIGQRDLVRIVARPAGIIVVGGAPFSHPMIRIMGLNIPTVLIEPEQDSRLQGGMRVEMDGFSGEIHAPNKRRMVDLPVAPHPPHPGVPVISADGSAVQLRASIGSVYSAAMAVSQGASAIGLVRSEYFFPENDEKPDAAFYENALTAICNAASPLPVTVRLLDIAEDKRPPWLKNVPGMGGVLGLQGARLYGTEPVRSVLHAELEALGRLTGFDLRLLIPYVVTLEELERWQGEIRHLLPENLAVGAMIETPAAAMAIKEWLSVVDFVAIGCNDLMQCFFAANRDLPELRNLLDPYAPVLYRFLGEVAELAGERIAKVQLCGLLSQLPHVLPVLLGLGYRIFSVEPVMIPYLAQLVARTDIHACGVLARRVCASTRPAEVRKLLSLAM